MGKEEDLEIYNSGDWAIYRSDCAGRYEWYDGTKFREKRRGGRRDAQTRERPDLWPLRLNPIARFANVHKAVMAGVQEDITELPVQTVVDRKGLDEGQHDQADSIELFLHKVWLGSAGLSSMIEAMLLLQIYGGHCFQVAWQPYDPAAAYGINIISHSTPARVWPVLWNSTRSNILEAYVGYMISARKAATLGVKTDEDEVLYLEHWTPEEYWIHVDGQQVRYKWGDQVLEWRGPNPWGRVPLVYIPHDRAGNVMGHSIVDGPQDLTGLARELNARLADEGDAAQAASQQLLVARNLGSEAMKLRPIRDAEGQTTHVAIDLGTQKPLPNAGEPDLNYVQAGGLPTSAAEFSDDVWLNLMVQGDVASVAMGMDDTASGRISGPVTAYRMFPTLCHTITERFHFSQGLIKVGELCLAMARAQAGAYEQLSIPAPVLPDMNPTLLCHWSPEIPIEVLQRVELNNARLQAQGISLRSYLEEMGCQDPAREEERIWQDYERKVEIEERAKANAMMNIMQQQMEQRGNGQNNQAVRGERQPDQGGDRGNQRRG